MEVFNLMERLHLSCTLGNLEVKSTVHFTPEPISLPKTQSDVLLC